MFAYQDTAGGVEIAFTDRHGGTSGGPFASLNLSDATGDRIGAAAENLALLARSLAPGDVPPRPVLM
ncbi:MAG: laccase domain-containing protein, partial [Nocardioidaceae bacterium]